MMLVQNPPYVMLWICTVNGSAAFFWYRKHYICRCFMRQKSIKNGLLSISIHYSILFVLLGLLRHISSGQVTSPLLGKLGTQFSLILTPSESLISLKIHRFGFKLWTVFIFYCAFRRMISNPPSKKLITPLFSSSSVYSTFFHWNTVIKSNCVCPEIFSVCEKFAVDEPAARETAARRGWDHCSGGGGGESHLHIEKTQTQTLEDSQFSPSAQSSRQVKEDLNLLRNKRQNPHPFTLTFILTHFTFLFSPWWNPLRFCLPLPTSPLKTKKKEENWKDQTHSVLWGLWIECPTACPPAPHTKAEYKRPSSVRVITPGDHSICCGRSHGPQWSRQRRPRLSHTHSHTCAHTQQHLDTHLCI